MVMPRTRTERRRIPSSARRRLAQALCSIGLGDRACKGEGQALIGPLDSWPNTEQAVEGSGHEGFEVNGPLLSERMDEDQDVLAGLMMFELELGRESCVVFDERNEVVQGDGRPTKQDVFAGLRGTLLSPDGSDFFVGELGEHRTEEAVPDGHEADFRFEAVPLGILHELAVRETVEGEPLVHRVAAHRFHQGSVKPERKVLMLLSAGLGFGHKGLLAYPPNDTPSPRPPEERAIVNHATGDECLHEDRGYT